mmetsp:Transcript_11541/g.16941  ORF Transcript_11541/g.16941 Transcript_11541/m.16941 type:complete len:174 (+) Transcript_11541:330-851(+)
MATTSERTIPTKKAIMPRHSRDDISRIKGSKQPLVASIWKLFQERTKQQASLSTDSGDRSENTNKHHRVTKQTADESFPETLHRMLTELEAAGRDNTVSFLPHGRAFVINCEFKFVHETMPNYFRIGRFTSFERQLYLYGFRKVSSGPDSGAYFHELFQKTRPKLAAYIKTSR